MRQKHVAIGVSLWASAIKNKAALAPTETSNGSFPVATNVALMFYFEPSTG